MVIEVLAEYGCISSKRWREGDGYNSTNSDMGGPLTMVKSIQ